MISKNEPIFSAEFHQEESVPQSDTATVDGIRRLIEDQPFGVLCTQGQGQPYGSLIAFAQTDDLKHVYFTTSIATRKFRLLSECDRAALLVDSRNRHPGSLMDVEALTVTGRTRHLKSGHAYERGIDLLIQRHNYLKAFIRCESTALFCFDVIRYFYVTRFQEVRQWIP
jgi:nitroimidazol reductase NimA-like FMN-containing flavoprotein (pyridoxamine 5'-phosphate oxidase superfamily)